MNAQFLKYPENYLGKPYKPWSQMLLEIAIKDTPPADALLEFCTRYSLFDSTMLLFQLFATGKGIELPSRPDPDRMDGFYKDFTKVLIAIYQDTGKEQQQWLE